MRSWDTAKRPPTAAEWSRAREALREANALDPAQPAYLEDLGRLYEVRAQPLAPGDALAREYLQQSLEYQRAALRRRPGSPYTWANIALLKLKLEALDAEFERALRNAALLGPWEPGVQIAVADSGLAAWSRLGPEARAAVSADLARGSRWLSASMIEIARRARRLDVLCSLPEMRSSPGAGACI